MGKLQQTAVLILFGLLLLTGCSTSKPVNFSWQYRVDRVPTLPPPRSGLQEYLDSNAVQGWILDQLVDRPGELVVVMKRSKPE